MTLENPIRAIREISHDMTCRRTGAAGERSRGQRPRHPDASTSTGRCVTPTAKGLSPLEMTGTCRCGALRHHDRAGSRLNLDREVDWVIKYRLLEAYRAKHDLPLGHPKVALMDLQYHDVNRTRSLFYLMQDRDLVERMCTDADIDDGRRQSRPRRRGPASRRVHPPGQGAQARRYRSTGST